MFRPYSELMKLFQFLLLTVHHASSFWFITNQLTHGVESFFEELRAPWLVKFPTFMGCKELLPYSKEPTIWPCPKLDESSLSPAISSPKDSF